METIRKSGGQILQLGLMAIYSDGNPNSVLIFGRPDSPSVSRAVPGQLPALGESPQNTTKANGLSTRLETHKADPDVMTYTKLWLQHE